MSEKEEKLLEQIRETLNYHQIVWFDGERFQLKGTKQELYQWLYCMRRWLNMAWQERMEKETERYLWYTKEKGVFYVGGHITVFSSLSDRCKI